MKKLLSLVLALVVLCACVPASAATPYKKGGTLQNESHYATRELQPGTAYMVENVDVPFAPTSVTVYKVNMPANKVQAQAAATFAQNGNGLWDVDISSIGMDQDATRDDREQKYVIEYTDGTRYYYVNYYVNAQGNGKVLATFDAYYQGHANAFGPKVDGSWKTYAVVDLAVQGTQSYKLIASGGWYLGTVSVTVDGDQVVVDYLMAEDVNTADVHDDLFVKGEYVNIFADAASIDMNAESSFEFGKAISISGDLAGDTVVCLFVDVECAYNVSCPFVTRFWPNLRENKNIVETMNVLLGQ
ncbi:MAG: hypothetical protein IJE07_08835 [Clostridia bacterium]|nr:hypothetical protein [Clostridia bacterium]